MIFAALIAASQLLYVAKVTTFGCSSIDEIAKLQSIRLEKKAFRTELYEQIFDGQCVEIARGTLVEGSIEIRDASMLLVDRQIEPPGFEAPLRDFKLKRAGGKK
jgi:hypothetical protein